MNLHLLSFSGALDEHEDMARIDAAIQASGSQRLAAAAVVDPMFFEYSHGFGMIDCPVHHTRLQVVLVQPHYLSRASRLFGIGNDRYDSVAAEVRVC